MITLGFDPGGKRGFGFALSEVDEMQGTTRVIEASTGSSVDEAIEWSLRVSEGMEVQGIGIDTLLFWQSTPSGWRGADEWLRRRYPSVQNSVSASNSLFGSMSVQGAILAKWLRDQWPKSIITETHPKVLWHHFNTVSSYPRRWAEEGEAAVGWLTELQITSMTLENEHELDAAISSWAVGQALLSRWRIDLCAIKSGRQMRSNVTVCERVNYFWPGELHA